MWSELVEFSSLFTLSGGLAGGVEFMTLLRILRNTTEQLAEATIFSLRYTTIAKPTFRFEYVHVYCQLADQPRQHFCDEILICNDACIYLTQNSEHNLLVKPL